jgi:hypothetical protein
MLRIFVHSSSPHLLRINGEDGGGQDSHELMPALRARGNLARKDWIGRTIDIFAWDDLDGDATGL